MARADAALAAAAGADTLTLAGHADVEVHAVDTDGGVVLDTEINVLRDTESEVAGLGEVALAELVLLDLEATLENLLSLESSSQSIILPAQFRISPKLSYLGATDGDVDSNLFVTADTEGTDGVAGLAYRVLLVHRVLSWELLVMPYCKRGFDRTAAPKPSRHGSVCHQTRRRRC